MKTARVLFFVSNLTACVLASAGIARGQDVASPSIKTPVLAELVGTATDSKSLVPRLEKKIAELEEELTSILVMEALRKIHPEPSGHVPTTSQPRAQFPEGMGVASRKQSSK